MRNLLDKLIEALDYTLDKSESEEVILEINFHGAGWDEDRRTDLDDDENPGGMFNEKYLTDTVPLSILEFSTTSEHSGEHISLQDLKDFREALKKILDE